MEIISVEQNEQPVPFKDTPVNLKRCNGVLVIMDSLSGYLPLTVRSVYYKVISSPKYKKGHWRSQKGKYKGKNLRNPEEQVGEILKHLRLKGKVEWNAINDESRIITNKVGKTDFNSHVSCQLDFMYLSNFDRCRAADQENYIEIWVEKNGLVHIVKSIADKFC